SDSSDPAARAASTDRVGSTHSDPRTYSDSASRRIMASLPHADAYPHAGQSPQNTGPTLTTGWHDPVPVNRSSRETVTVNARAARAQISQCRSGDGFIVQSGVRVSFCAPPRWLSRSRRRSREDTEPVGELTAA